MANLAYQKIELDGLSPIFTAADAAGDKIKPYDLGFLHVKNGSASPVTVTLVTPGETRFGVDQPDRNVTIAAGGEALIPGLTHDLVSDVDTGSIAITYSSVTTVTRAAFRL